MLQPCPTRAEISELLRSHGVHPTRQRVEIAYALFAGGEHLSADQLLALVNRSNAETSKATVYNTLNLLVAKGLVRQVIVDPSRIFYDPNTSPHHHFFNTDTGRLTDIDRGSIEVSGLPPLPEGMVAESVEVIVRLRSGV